MARVPRSTAAILLAGMAAFCSSDHARGTSGDPDEYQRKFDPLLRQTLEWISLGAPGANAPGDKNAATGSAAATLFVSEYDAAGALRIPCWIRFDGGRATPKFAAERSYGTGLSSARLSPAEIEALARDPRVRSIHAARRTKPLLDSSLIEVNAQIVHDGSGTPPVYNGMVGTGVLVGLVDTGVDLDHADLRDGTGTRLESIWDQTVATFAPPSGFSYGREWSKAQINGGSCSEIDDEGHGTHVLSTAGGDGSATGNAKPAYRYVGMAPAAKLVGVKTDFYTTSIVDAVDYVFDRASSLGLPAVVNLSLGHHFGPHDGNDDADQALNALAGPGRIVVAAAGNEQEDGIHAEGTAAAGDSVVITLLVGAYTTHPGAQNDYALLDGFYTGTANVSVTVGTPNGHRVGPVLQGNTADVNSGDGGVYIENDYAVYAGSAKNAFVQIYDKVAGNPPDPGTWRIVVKNLGPSPRPSADAQPPAPEVDFWMASSTFGTQPVFVQGMTAEELVASPATADSVIAVAAYVTKAGWASVDGHNYQYSPVPTVGSLAPFSSHGPRRDGALKPDIAAPGMGIGAALSSDASVPSAYVLTDGVHYLTQGTSMAAPHVTGLVALMLEAHGVRSKRWLLERLAGTARGDAFTGVLPNASWGHGKIESIGATTNVTPVRLGPVDVARHGAAIRLSWSVPLDVAAMEFEVFRQNDGDSREVSVGRTGRGPDYSFDDVPLLRSDVVNYWLVGYVEGALAGRFGPFSMRDASDSRRFTLSDLRPNPTAGETYGALHLPMSGPVRIEIIDAAGRVVRVLEQASLPPGAHGFSWDGRDDAGRGAPSGMYWVRAAWHGQSLSRRLLLLKRD